MATVAAKVFGGDLQEIDVDTVGDARAHLGLGDTYTATVNGEAEDDSFGLEDGDWVVFTKSVKGG